MEKVNLALIGCGYWGKNHLRTLNEIDAAELSYVCDNQEISIKIPERTKFAKDYKEILKEHCIDGVIIATPTSTHYSLAKTFLNAGKNVFVEKPLATKSSEAEELCYIAQRNGLVLMVGEIFRFNPALRYLSDLIKSKEVGDLRYIESRRVGLGPIRNDVSALWDLATHDIYISNFLVGRLPNSVSYQGISHNENHDDISCLNLKYKNPNVLTTIYVNWEHPIKERKIIVGATKKAVLFDDVEPSHKIIIYESGVNYQPSSGDFGEFQAATRDGDIIIPKLKLKQPLEEELKHFLECIKNDVPCLSSGCAGLQTVKVLEAAEVSRTRGGLEIRIQ